MHICFREKTQMYKQLFENAPRRGFFKEEEVERRERDVRFSYWIWREVGNSGHNFFFSFIDNGETCKL